VHADVLRWKNGCCIQHKGEQMNSKKMPENPQKRQYSFPPWEKLLSFSSEFETQMAGPAKTHFFCEFAQIILFFLARHRNKAKKKQTPKCKIIQKRTLSHSNKIHVNPSSFFWSQTMVPTLPQTKCKINTLGPQQPENS